MDILKFQKGDILESIREPNFILEVIDTDSTEIFVGKVIYFPDRSSKWANTQKVGNIGRYLKRDFKQSISGKRNIRLDQLGI